MSAAEHNELLFDSGVREIKKLRSKFCLTTKNGVQKPRIISCTGWSKATTKLSKNCVESY